MRSGHVLQDLQTAVSFLLDAVLQMNSFRKSNFITGGLADVSSQTLSRNVCAGGHGHLTAVNIEMSQVIGFI